MAKTYKDLIAWQKAFELTAAVYQVTQKFPDQERFGLTAQIRRSALAIVDNIADGQARDLPAEFARSLAMAQGQAQQLETQLLLAIRLGFLPEDAAKPHLDATDEVGKLVRGLQKSVRHQ